MRGKSKPVWNFSFNETFIVGNEISEAKILQEIKFMEIQWLVFDLLWSFFKILVYSKYRYFVFYRFTLKNLFEEVKGKVTHTK